MLNGICFSTGNALYLQQQSRTTPKSRPKGGFFRHLTAKKHTIFFKKGPILFKKHTIL